MQELKHNDRIFQYPEVIEEMKEKNRMFNAQQKNNFISQ